MLLKTNGMCFLMLFLLLPISANAVVIDGRNWMQVTETLGYTYNDLANGPCDASTGLCTGVVVRSPSQSVDLTGWTWASSGDIADLFEFVTGAPAGTFDVDTTGYFESTTIATWAADFIDTDGVGSDTGYFNSTFEFSTGDNWVAGLTRTIVAGDTDRSYIRAVPTSNQSIVGNPHGFDTSRAHTGMWLYETQTVPGPATLLLFLVGLFGIALQTRSTNKSAY